MSLFLNFFIFIPLGGFIVSLLIPRKKEVLISGAAVYTTGLHLLSFLLFLGFWLFHIHPTLYLKDLVLFQAKGYEFFISIYFDSITAVYLFVGAFLTFLVSIYSRYYMHRETGYKRFFNNILFFYLGYSITILSGNLETMFVGWEILGISSFLLISFYRNRYLPVKNAVKVFSIYRIGDVGMLLAIWMSHHLWHENISFLKLHDTALVHHQLQTHSLIGVFISLMILIPAAAKSAQLPFSSWLPRAMEGPTPSSAIFYGSLSVHIGVFLLLRTFPFWEHQFSVRIVIGLLGLFTSIVCTGISRVQSSVKSQIAYSSIAQIGLMFIEVAVGLGSLALLHFAGNAFLRTYQLLVSPSVVTYLIREQFYNFIPRQHSFEKSLPKKIAYSFYILCLKEWNLDSLLYRFLWNPVKWVGNRLQFLTVETVVLVFVPVYLFGLLNVMYPFDFLGQFQRFLPNAFSAIGLLMVLKSFTKRRWARISWIMIMMSHFWIALAIAYNGPFDTIQVAFYLSGVTVSGIIGFICLQKLRRREAGLDLSQFHGLSYKHPQLALVFLLACLGLAGFPITPTFIGEDLIFSHIQEEQVFLAFTAALSFIVSGLSIIRIYARVFLGPHLKAQPEMALRSS